MTALLPLTAGAGSPFLSSSTSTYLRCHRTAMARQNQGTSPGATESSTASARCANATTRHHRNQDRDAAATTTTNNAAFARKRWTIGAHICFIASPVPQRGQGRGNGQSPATVVVTNHRCLMAGVGMAAGMVDMVCSHCHATRAQLRVNGAPALHPQQPPSSTSV